MLPEYGSQFFFFFCHIAIKEFIRFPLHNIGKLTCNMKKPDQPKQLPRSIRVPVAQFWPAEGSLEDSWWLIPRVCIKSIMGPLYSVITMAPVTVIKVPITLAWLGIFLILIFSNL